MNTQDECSQNIGPTFDATTMCGHSRRAAGGKSTSSLVDSPVRTSAKRTSSRGAASTASEAGCGGRCSESSSISSRDGASSKIRISSGESGCRSCGGNCGSTATCPCPWESIRLHLEPAMRGDDASLLPTPTAIANQLSPSMRKHPACRRLQGLVGRTGGLPHPALWEWLMGFPIGHSDCGDSVTPSAPT